MKITQNRFLYEASVHTHEHLQQPRTYSMSTYVTGNTLHSFFNPHYTVRTKYVKYQHPRQAITTIRSLERVDYSSLG